MRQLLRAFAISVCLTACSLAGTASASSAEAPSLGVIAIEQPNSADFDRMGAAGLDVYRANFYWAAVQPFSSDSFNWNGTAGHGYDDMVCDAARNGIQILPTVFGSPSWANGGKAPEFPPTPAHRDEFGAFLAAAEARYGPGGTIWTDPESPCSGMTPIPIAAWQIWNEPNLKYFWAPKPNADSYMKMLAEAHRTLDPLGADVMLAGLSPRPRPRFGTWPTEYLNDLYKAGIKPYFDLMAAHPYDLKPSGMARQVNALRDVMAKYRDADRDLWVTEFGWASGGPKSTLTVKPMVQAAYLKGSYRIAVTKPKLGIKGLIWYAFRDVPFKQVSPPATRDGWIYHSGLLTSKGIAKPAWKTLAELAGGSAN